MHNVRRHLTSDEHIALVERAQKGDNAARDKLVVSCTDFIFSHARKWAQKCKCPVEDMANEGVFGLIEAINRFEPKHGSTFLSYAAWWVRKRMDLVASEENRQAFGKAPLANNRGLWNEVKHELRQGKNYWDATEIAAGRLGMPGKEARRRLSFQRKRFTHVEMDFLHNISDDYLDQEKEAMRQEITDKVRQCIQNLQFNERDQAIINQRLLVEEDCGPTLKQIAAQFGVSAARMQQLEQRIVQRLREALQGVLFSE